MNEQDSSFAHERRKNGISIFQIYRYAFRNIGRRKQRSILVMLVISVSLMSYIAVDSLLRGIQEQGMNNVIAYQTGNFHIETKEYAEQRDQHSLASTLFFEEKDEENLSRMGWDSIGRSVFNGVLQIKSPPFPIQGILPITVNAVYPDKEIAFYKYTMEKGTFAIPYNGVVIGKWLADRLNAQIGYPIIVEAPFAGGTVSLSLLVSGIFTTPNPLVNRSQVFINYGYANNRLQLNDTVNEVHLKKKLFTRISESDIVAVRKYAEREIRAARDKEQVTVVSWQEIVPKTVVVLNPPSGISFIYMGLLLLIAIAGIFNTVQMNMFERVKEIATLRVFGLNTFQNYLMVLCETSIMGLGGSLGGVLLGLGAVFALTTKGLDYSMFFKEHTMDLSLQVFYGAWNPYSYGIAVAIGMGITLVTAMYAARHINKTPIVSLLRNRT